LEEGREGGKERKKEGALQSESIVLLLGVMQNAKVDEDGDDSREGRVTVKSSLVYFRFTSHLDYSVYRPCRVQSILSPYPVHTESNTRYDKKTIIKHI
jgi:hypothetical protein